MSAQNFKLLTKVDSEETACMICVDPQTGERFERFMRQGNYVNASEALIALLNMLEEARSQK